jgi:hypothetical protein
MPPLDSPDRLRATAVFPDFGGVGGASGLYSTAGKARTGLFVAIGAAALAGAGVAWMNFLLALGAGL